MSVSAFYSASRIIPVILDLGHLCKDLTEYNNDNDLVKASIVNRLALLSFSSLSMLMSFLNCSAGKQFCLKSIEMLPRTLEIPIAFLKELEDSNGDSIEKIYKIVEKGLITPLVDLIRVVGESLMCEEASYLEKTPEELEYMRRPIMERDPISGLPVCVGYRPIDLNECRKNLVDFEFSVKKAYFVETMTSVGVVEKAICPLYHRLAAYLAPVPANIPNPVQVVLNPVVVPNDWDVPDFFSLDRIPLPLHEDMIFSRYICPITQEPIRDPVCDPNGITLYERSAILNWLGVAQVSPMTRLPLTPGQLLSRPSVKALIDYRLRQHRDGFRNYLQQQLNAPLNQNAPVVEGIPRI